MNNLSYHHYFQMAKQCSLLILLSLSVLACKSQITNHTQNQHQEKVENTKAQLRFTSGIRAILEDSKGNIWLGSDQEGVSLFDGISYQYFTVKEGLSDNQVRSIQEDDNGNIWFGTAKGACSYDGEKIINHTQNSTFIKTDHTSNKWVKTKNDLWFNAGRANGVYRYDGQKITYLTFPKTKHLINLDHNYQTTGVANGKSNRIWIATYAGVFGFDNKKFTILNDEQLGFDYHTGYLHVRSILEDSKGNLWIGNNGIGVLKYKGDSIINFSESQDLISKHSGRNGFYRSPPQSLEHVFAIEEDSSGNIWFGDRDTGAWKYDGSSMTNYTIDDQLKSQMILDIYQDKNGHLLFGMAEGGVYIFNGNSFERKY